MEDNIEKILRYKHTKSSLFGVFSVIVLWQILIRFIGITEIGMMGDDVFYYWELASEWAKGNRFITFHYRPFVHFINSISILLFGENDYAIKILNSTLSLGSGVLMFLISKRLTDSKIIQYLGPILYLSIPFVVVESRSELAHIPSAFFLLLSFYFFIRSEEKQFQEIYFLYSSGFVLGLAAHIHPDLATLGLPYFLFIVATIYIEQKHRNDFDNQFRIRIKKSALGFTSAYFLTFLIFIVHSGPLNVIKNLSKGFNHQNVNNLENTTNRFLRYFEGIHSYLIGNFSLLGTIIIYISTLLIIILIFNKKVRILSPRLLLFVIPLFHILTCITIVQRRFLVRLLHPTLPLIILGSLIIIHIFLLKKKSKHTNTILILTVGCFFLSFKPHLLAKNRHPSIYRAVHNIAGDKIKRDEKLLVTPAMLHWYREGFSSKAYFGDFAVYLSRFRFGEWTYNKNITENFKRIIKEKKIGYILVVKKDPAIRDELNRHSDAELFLKRIYNMNSADYSLEKEILLLREVIKNLGGDLIYGSDRFEIFKLN